MRATLACLFALLAPCGVSAEPQVAVGARDDGSVFSRVRPGDESSVAAERESAEAAARQSAFDDAIAQRSRRAARSVCDTCGAADARDPARRRAVTTPRALGRSLDAELIDAPSHDPAQARLD